MTNDLLKFSLEKIINLLKEKKLSPVEIMEATLNKIEKDNPVLNSFITVDYENALNRAKELEKSLYKGNTNILHGVPIGLKDNINTKGLRTTYGSPIYKNHVPNEDAFITKVLKDSGAIIVGKHLTHQFAYGPTGDRSHVGAAKNPHDITKMTGGSSGGSAASVAANLNYGAVGTDTGGSIRIPSAFCGVVGMKPTYGTVSNRGVYPLVWSMDHVGPITRTVKDNAIMLNVLSQFDSEDFTSVYRKREDFTRFIGNNIKDKVIGIPTNFFYDDLDPEINEKMQDIKNLIQSIGSKVKFIYMNNMDRLLDSQKVIMRTEAYLNHKRNLKEYPNLWDDEVKERLLTGSNVELEQYSNALKDKYFFTHELNKHFTEVDIIITPTTPILPLNINERKINKKGKEGHVRDWVTKLTAPFNLIGFPCLSMPVGFSKTHLPIGLQLIGKKFDEAVIYQVGYAIEQQLSVNK